MKKLVLFVLLCTSFLSLGQSVRDIATQDIDTYDIWIRPFKMQRKIPLIPGQTVSPKKFLGNIHLDTLAKKVGLRVFGVMTINNTLDIDKPISNAAESRFGLKVDKVSGKGLSSNDFANNYKIKLDNLDANFNLKASKNYVDSVNNLKASIQSVGLKSERAYVDAIFSLKADVSSLNQKLHAVYSKAALVAYDGNSVFFDGCEWNKYSGNEPSNGGVFPGTIINVSTNFYWKRKTNIIDVEYFGAKGDNATINTVAFQNAVNFINNSVQAVSEVVNGVTDVYTASLYTLNASKGRYKIDDVIIGGAYLNIKGDNSAIIQTVAGKDIFYSNSFYKWSFDGINFVGGKNHISVGNNNIDGTILKITNCNFSLSSDYAINTFVTGTTFFHLSANLLIDKSYFSRCKQGIKSFCDLTKISNTWVHWDKDNMSANTAFIYFRGDDNHSILTLDSFFGVPVAGVGVARVNNVRWIDAWGSVYADNSRFGGEDAGIPIVYFFQPYNTVYPHVGKTVSIEDSWIYSGISDKNDSGTIIINGQVPQKISLINNDGPSDVPYIVNYSATNLANYFTDFETATGKKAYNYFSIDIKNNMSNGTSGNIYNKKIPDELRPFIVGTKQTIVRRLVPQVINNGFVANAISFDNVAFDNAGCFVTASPTRLTLPIGASRASIKVYFKISGHATSEILTVKLKDSSGNLLGGFSNVTAVNADDNAYSFSADVLSYTNNDFYFVELYTNATANLSLIDARVSISLVDYIN